MSGMRTDRQADCRVRWILQKGWGVSMGGGLKSIPGLEKASAEARREQNTGRRVLQKKV